MESNPESNLETRYCEFEKDFSSSNLGQRNTNDNDTRTKLTHSEFLGCGIIATVSCLAYGTWQGQSAALLILVFRLRASEGLFRLRRAELSLSFKPKVPDESHPVVRKIWPKNNRPTPPQLRSQASSTSTLSAASSSSSGTRTQSSSGLWPIESYSISSNDWLDRGNEEPHQAGWRLAEPTGSSMGICGSIPLGVVVTYSGPFQASIRASGSTFGKIKIQALPWSQDEPLLFDGVTTKGWQVAETEFSGISDDYMDEFILQEGLSGPPSHTRLSPSGRPEATPLQALEQSFKVYRVHGIPSTLTSETLIHVIATSLSLPKDSIQVRSFCEGHNTAVVSFTSAHPETRLGLFDQGWQLIRPPVGTSDDGTPLRQLRMQFDRGFLGFTNVGLIGDGMFANVDIIAIHGLGGHAYGSFKQRQGNHMWITDSLPNDLAQGQALNGPVTPRILVYGYDARVEKSNTFQTIEDLAIELNLLLREIRRENSSRPMIFICHSLGGLIVKELMIQSWKSETDHHCLATIGLLFFGVPNRGMDISELLAIIESQPNKAFLETLSVGSPFLERQAKLFPMAFESQQAVVYSFYETCLSNTARIVDGKLSMTGDPVVLVDKDSATHSRPWEMEDTSFRVPIRRSHADLVKFEQYSPDYVMVRGCIRDILTRHFSRERHQPPDGVRPIGAVS